MHYDLGFVATGLGVFSAIVAALIGYGTIKKTLLETADKALSLSQKSSEELRGQTKRQKTQFDDELRNIRSAFSLQEKRIYRMEVDASRKRRQLALAKREIEYLESIVRVFLDELTSLGEDKKRKVEIILHELANFRLRTAQEMSDKDELEETLDIYLDRVVAGTPPQDSTDLPLDVAPH